MSNALYFALGEAFERFAPEAEWASDVHPTIESDVTDLRIELESAIDAKIERAEARIRGRFVIPTSAERKQVAS